MDLLRPDAPKRNFNWAVAIIIGTVLLWIAFWGMIIAVAWHFIAKYW